MPTPDVNVLDDPPQIGSRAVPPGLGRYLAIYAAFWRNSLVREMGFKINFILWIVVEMLWFGLQLTFMAVIYSHTDRIASWTKWQVVLLVGANHFVQQLFTALFMNNCVKLSENVRSGGLDFMLLMPVNARFLISLRHVDFGAFVNAASAVAVMVYAGVQLGLQPSVVQLVGAAVLLLLGLSIHYSVMYILACISFWTVRAQGIVWGYYNLFQLARLPDEAFRGMFRMIFTFVVPVLLVTNVPVKVLLEKLSSWSEMAWLGGMSVAIFWLSEAFWRWSVRHYGSASS
ncbi:MAG: ABC-2 family transporter protein [Verrucomicrobiales bacterium]|nr:ABC-2 family transporter protein [Verrucomicrobiales bacterium]